MKGKLITVLLVAMLSGSFAGLTNAEKVSHFYDFENSYEPWTARADMGYAVTKIPIQLLGTQPRLYKSGNVPIPNLCAALTNKGANAVWMQAAFAPEGNAVRVEFDVMNLGNAQRLTPIIYAGMRAPQNLYDFQKVGLPLEKGKQHLKVDLPLTDQTMGPKNISQALVAVGFMNLDGEQTAQVAGIDNINVTLYYR
jgi:hypothetical protein